MKRLPYVIITSLLLLSTNCSSKGQYITPDKPSSDTTDTSQNTGGNSGKDTTSTAETTEYNDFNIVGVDQFGRSFSTITGYKDKHLVGLFFWPWIGQPYATGIYDATKIMALPNGLKILTDFNSYDPQISPNGQAHYWGEPLWGYYNSEDEWVTRRQLQMITTAGVDFIFFDTTNALIYSNIVLKVMQIIDEMIQEGWDAPKVMFYTHSHSFATTRELYNTIYKQNRYRDTWLIIDGKPAIIAYTDVNDDLAEAKSRNDTNYDPGILSSEILNFFHFFKPQWPSDPVFPNGFPWIEWKFPQPLHTESKVMNVTVASHPMVPMSFSLTRGWTNWGRGWDVALKKNVSEDVDKGTFFQSEWDRAIEADPPIVSVGGWNEWIAYKQPYDGEYMLCDAASKEYSRDIEPMKGGYEDAFYLQLIRNIRLYKGVGVGEVTHNESNTIDINKDVDQWSKVKFLQRNSNSKFMKRDSYGGSQTIRYTQDAPKDKMIQIKVTHDKDYIYFYIKGKDAFSEYSGKNNWLNIFIGGGEPSLKEWESYDYVLKAVSENKISIQKFNDGFSSKEIGSGEMRVDKNAIQISVSRDFISEYDKFYFKAAMGVESPSDIMDYYKTGCAMPMGRLSYMYYFD